MKVLLVTGNYLPGKNGGIENYTHWLATALLQEKIEAEVAALQVKERSDYFYEGIKVNYLDETFEAFEQVLQNGHYDICHFHEYSEYGGIEIPWFKKAKEYCRKVFFTFHLPYLTCYKNDLRYRGLEDCNTFNNPSRCAECIIFERSKNVVGRPLAPVGTLLAVITGLNRKLENKVRFKHECLNELLSTCDEVFIIANWFKELLFTNAYSDNKIQRIPNKPGISISRNSLADNKIVKNKILFVGRIQHQKGLHLLCKAMNQIGQKNLQLDVYGNKVDNRYFDECIKTFSFNYQGVIPSEILAEQFKNYDFLVLPSVFTEMYPLVIREAFSAKLPIIASAAKGNADAITNDVNGFLFEYDNAEDLAKTIDKAYRLKGNGWLPEFSYPENPQKDIEKIVSYYN